MSEPAWPPLPGDPLDRLPCVVVTRPQPQADEWVERLTALGAPAVALPLLRIESDEAFAPAVEHAWQTLAQCSLVMFVSPNAVLSFFAQCPAGQAWPQGVTAAATGPGTVSALMACGVPANLILAPGPQAERFDAETLWADALQSRDWRGRTVRVVRGETGRDWLADTLRAAGATVEVLAGYRQCGPRWTETVMSRLAEVAQAPARFVWLFSSSRAVGHLLDRLREDTSASAALASVALATHPRIAETAQDAGFTTVGLVRPDPAAVIEALRAWATPHR